MKQLQDLPTELLLKICTMSGVRSTHTLRKVNRKMYRLGKLAFDWARCKYLISWNRQCKKLNEYGPQIGIDCGNIMALQFIWVTPEDRTSSLKIPPHIKYLLDYESLLTPHPKMCIPWTWDNILPNNNNVRRAFSIPRFGDVIDQCYIVGTDISCVKLCNYNGVSIGKSLLCKPTNIVMFKFEKIFPLVAIYHQDVYIKIVAKNIKTLQVRFGYLNNTERCALSLLDRTIQYSNGVVTFKDGHYKIV